MTTSTISSSLFNTFGGFSLIEPRPIREERERFRRQRIPELDLANSYYSLSGLWPDVGWLLIARKDYDQIDPYATNLQLVLCDFVNEPLVVNNLTVVQARCVTRGLASDPNAIYLVQVANAEGIIYNPWFKFPTTSQYNVRAPAYDGSYYSGSLNVGVAWTWDGMVGDLWNQASAILGAYPGLPIVPTGTPENFTFVGVSLWEAITRVLDLLGLSVAGDNDAFTIVVSGAADPVYEALASSSPLEDSMEYLDIGSGRVPKEVIVYFHRRNAVYGTEETVRADSLQWQGTPVYSVTVAAPADFASAVGTAWVWSDFAVRYDMDGNPLAADVTSAAAIAAERTTEFFNKIHEGTRGMSRDVYAGLIPFTTGSLVDGVRWYNTGLHPDDYAGWRTEVVRGFVWEEATFSRAITALMGVGPT